jgi:hypothetical protein
LAVTGVLFVHISHFFSQYHQTETRQLMNYPLPPDAIIYEFSPHTLIALVCLMAASVILLIRVLIDHADSAKGSNDKK